MTRAGRRDPHRRSFNAVQLSGLVLVILLSTILPLSWIWNRLQDPAVIPVRLVRVEGELRHLNPRHLEEVVYGAVDGSFFSVSLAKLRAEVERLPWVDSVSLRRVWPDTLLVKVIEQQPLARWGRNALVNLRGEIFRPDSMAEFSDLTRLEGDEQDSVVISQEYEKLQTLLRTVGLELEQASVDPRRAWLLRTRHGLELNLGRKQILTRLTRFVRLYPGLQSASGLRLKQVDLRYTNGFTAIWDELPERQTNGDNPAVGGTASRLAGI